MLQGLVWSASLNSDTTVSTYVLCTQTVTSLVHNKLRHESSSVLAGVWQKVRPGLRYIIHPLDFAPIWTAFCILSLYVSK